MQWLVIRVLSSGLHLLPPQDAWNIGTVCWSYVDPKLSLRNFSLFKVIIKSGVIAR